MLRALIEWVNLNTAFCEKMCYLENHKLGGRNGRTSSSLGYTSFFLWRAGMWKREDHLDDFQREKPRTRYREESCSPILSIKTSCPIKDQQTIRLKWPLVRDAVGRILDPFIREWEVYPQLSEFSNSYGVGWRENVIFGRVRGCTGWPLRSLLTLQVYVFLGFNFSTCILQRKVPAPL